MKRKNNTFIEGTEKKNDKQFTGAVSTRQRNRGSCEKPDMVRNSLTTSARVQTVVDVHKDERQILSYL